MEISFAGVDAAEASLLVRELELALKKAGAPVNSITVTSTSSPDSMPFWDLFLTIDVNEALHALGAIGYIACFGKCIYEVIGKHSANARIQTKSGSAEIPPDLELDKIKEILSELRDDKPPG